MNTEYASKYGVTRNDKVPLDTHNTVVEQKIAEQAAQLQSARAATAHMSASKERHRAELQAFLGAEKWRRFRQHLAEQEKAYRERLTPRPGCEIADAVRLEVRQQRSAAAEAFLLEMGTNPAELRAFNRRLRPILAPGRSQGAGPLLAHQVPEAVRRASDPLAPVNAASSWTVVRPPYTDAATSQDGFVDGFTFSPTRYLDRTSGTVGSSSYLYDSDASDWDGGAMNYTATIGFWHFMPVAGLLDVWIEAQCSSNQHQLHFRDEFGFSDGFATQTNYILLKGNGGTSDEASLQEMSTFSKDDTEGTWLEHHLVNGTTYWAHLYSDVAFPANSYVFINVGTKTFNATFANDVAVYSTALFKWFIKSVSIASTGG